MKRKIIIYIYNKKLIMRLMGEMESTLSSDRTEAWKKTMKEKLGRDHLSSVKGYVVAGCILDILDDIWDRKEQKILKQYEEHMKSHYNVDMYRLAHYPPVSRETKKSYRLIKKEKKRGMINIPREGVIGGMHAGTVRTIALRNVAMVVRRILAC
jgi:hypothetical protein